MLHRNPIIKNHINPQYQWLEDDPKLTFHICLCHQAGDFGLATSISSHKATLSAVIRTGWEIERSPISRIFTDSALLAGSFIESQCPSVCIQFSKIVDSVFFLKLLKFAILDHSSMDSGCVSRGRYVAVSFILGSVLINYFLFFFSMYFKRSILKPCSSWPLFPSSHPRGEGTTYLWGNCTQETG